MVLCGVLYGDSVWCYATCGTEIAFLGTEIAYGATRHESAYMALCRDSDSEEVLPPISYATPTPSLVLT